MIERVSYIADDGTAFEDEDECLEYERTLMLKKYEHDIHMWDNEFQPIPITDSKALDKGLCSTFIMPMAVWGSRISACSSGI